MPKDTFKFAIKNAAGQYWKVSNGNVVPTPAVTYLSDSVIDWDKLQLNYKRDTTYLGIIRSYSPEQVRFVKDGALILRYIKNSQGDAEAVAYFEVSLLDDLTQLYNPFAYWTFDFSQTSNDELEFAVALMEGDLSARFKANVNVNYTTPLNDPALAPNFPEYNPLPANELPLTAPTHNPVPPPVPVHVYMDGFPILGAVQYTSANGQDDGVQVIDLNLPPPVSGVDVWAMGLAEYQTLGDYVVGETNISTAGSIGGASAVNDTQIFKAITTAGILNGTFKVSISYNIGFTYENYFGGAGPHPEKKLRLVYQLWDGAGGGWGTLLGTTLVKEDDVFVAAGATSPHLKWVGRSPEFTMSNKQILVVGYTYVTDGPMGGGGGVMLTIDAPAVFPALQVPYIQLNTTFIPASSVTRAISHLDLFKYLTAQMATNGGMLTNAYTSRSTLLSVIKDPTAPGNWDLDPTSTFFTCGDALRGLKTVTITDPYYNDGLPFDSYLVPAIYTNMADFAKDLLTDQCASVGIEKTGVGTDTMVAESLYYFFDDNTVIADLGENISGFRKEDFNEWRGTSIAFGQQDEQFDAINGPLEVLSEVDYTTPMTRIIRDIDHKTPYRSDPQGTELTRANIGNKTNVNSSSDNDTFKLHTQTNIPEEIASVQNWAGLSGYLTDPLMALRLTRATVSSGLPADLLSPGVGGYGMYNYTWTPQRKALRALPWLCSNYRGLVNSLLGISGYKKNIKVISDIGSGSVTESNWINVATTAQTYTPPFSSNPVTVQPAPIPAGRTTNMIFKPYKFFFDSPVPLNLPLLMTPPGTPGGGKMYGRFKFVFVRGDRKFPLSGFAWDVGITPGTNASYHYELLASPTCEIPVDL